MYQYFGQGFRLDNPKLYEWLGKEEDNREKEVLLFQLARCAGLFSAPGTAKEIGTIFLAMGAGLIAGKGYLGYAVLFSLLLGLVMLFYQKIGLGETKGATREKMLHITIPEDLDYMEVFDDLLERYTSAAEVVSVKTINMGSLFKLIYQITLKNAMEEKELIDALRCRNGNLEISITRQEAVVYEL